jgi:hypothetical protein
MITDERTSSRSAIAYSTHYDDPVWFLETKPSSTSGILSNLTQARNELEVSNPCLQIIVMLPYIDAVDQ